MAQYTGKITAVYVNVSKKGKEYATGFIRLPDANGNENSYKFLIFAEAEVNKIKQAGPERLKGQTITMDGEFKENTWNGQTTYQLFTNSVIIPEELLQSPIGETSPGNAPGGNETTPPAGASTAGQSPTPSVQPTQEVPSVNNSGAPEVPGVPEAPSIPGA